MTDVIEGTPGRHDAAIASQINTELDALIAQLQLLQRHAVVPDAGRAATSIAIDRSFLAVRRARALAQALLV
ncbi:MAG: hypothetical protein JWQ88_3082 [Rhodoferax sp.]|nr:hypothetical protein [Rhodoferax sp.]